jgi:hypothetical protein
MCNLSLPNNQFLAHISLLFLPNTPHSPSIITAAATCFDELILDTEMYEQSSESAHACVVKHIRARLLSQARRAGLVRVRAHSDRATIAIGTRQNLPT